MPIAGYSVGRDITVAIVWNGQNYQLTQLASFDARQVTKEVTADDLTTGFEHQVNIPQRWEGSLHYERTGGAIDRFIAAYEQAYFQGQNVLNATMSVRIQEPSGAVQKWKFLGTIFVMEDAGKFDLQDIVRQTLRFRARERMVN